MFYYPISKKTIKIFNTIIQANPNSSIEKKKVETISTGNCKVYPSELSDEKYYYYLNNIDLLKLCPN